MLPMATNGGMIVTTGRTASSLGTAMAFHHGLLRLLQVGRTPSVKLVSESYQKNLWYVWIDLADFRTLMIF
jgi:hypothetical protein